MKREPGKPSERGWNTLFVVPGLNTKNKEDRLIVLNRTALSVVGAQRGKDRTWVSV
jgi:hypothetical protein